MSRISKVYIPTKGQYTSVDKFRADAATFKAIIIEFMKNKLRSR